MLEKRDGLNEKGNMHGLHQNYLLLKMISLQPDSKHFKNLIINLLRPGSTNKPCFFCKWSDPLGQMTKVIINIINTSLYLYVFQKWLKCT